MNINIELIEAGVQVMIYGLIGVFTVLILFYLATKGLFLISDKLQQKEEK